MVNIEEEIPKKYRFHHIMMKYTIYLPEMYAVVFGFIFHYLIGILVLTLMTFRILINSKGIKMSEFKFSEDEYLKLNSKSFAYFLVFILVFSEAFDFTSFASLFDEMTSRQTYFFRISTATALILNIYALIFTSHIYFRHFKGELFDTNKYLTSKHEAIGRWIYLHRFQTISLFYLAVIEIIGRAHLWLSLIVFIPLSIFYLYRPATIDKYLKPNKEYHLFLFFLALIITVPFATAYAVKLTPWGHLSDLGKLLSILMLFNSAIMLKKAFNFSIFDFFKWGK